MPVHKKVAKAAKKVGKKVVKKAVSKALKFLGASRKPATRRVLKAKKATALRKRLRPQPEGRTKRSGETGLLAAPGIRVKSRRVRRGPLNRALPGRRILGPSESQAIGKSPKRRRGRRIA